MLQRGDWQSCGAELTLAAAKVANLRRGRDRAMTEGTRQAGNRLVRDG